MLENGPSPAADATRRRWWAEAEQLGGTSALLHCAEGSPAVLDLTTAHPSGLAQLLAGGATALSSLVREAGAFGAARTRARAAHHLADDLLHRSGTRSLAVAVGTVGWGPAPRRTPVLLRRCTLQPTGESLDDFVVRLVPDVVVNPVLVRTARAELGLDVDAARVRAAVAGHRGFDPAPALEELRRQLAGAPGLRVQRRLLLTAFADPGADTVADLRRRGAQLREHPVVRALAEHRPPPAGDAPTADADTTALERAVTAAATCGIALDPAQRRAVEHVLTGGDLRLLAPTGTGATQVAAALVAAAAAAGRSVLLVADAAAERAAVDERLRAAGHGRLVLDLVADLDGAAVLARARAALDTAQAERRDRLATAPATGARPDPSAAAALLDAHARALHAARAPWGVSAHDAVAALAELAARPVPPTTTRRLRGEALTRCSRADLPGWVERLAEAVRLGAFTATPATTPWAGAQLRTDDAAAEAVAVVDRLVTTALPTMRARLATVCDAAGLRGAASVAEAVERVGLLDGVRASTQRFGDDVFSRSLSDVAAATGTAQHRREQGTRLGPLARFRLRRAARAMLTPAAGTVETPVLHEWLQQARAQRLAWQRVSVRDAPTVPAGLDDLAAAVTAVRADLVVLDAVLPAHLLAEHREDRARAAVRAGRQDGSDGSGRAGADGTGTLLDLPLPELHGVLTALLADAGATRDLPRRTVLLDELAAGGWQGLLDDLAARRAVPDAVLAAEVHAAWWAGVLEAVQLDDDLVGAPDGAALRTARHELQLADAAARAHDAARLRARVDTTAAAPAELLPCWSASAAAVAGVLGGGAVEELRPADPFDLLVVLGAQATSTAAALPALARARQVVVVGDPELPGPATVATAVAGDPVPAAGESLLAEAADALPSLRLVRQHAGRDDALVDGVVDAAGQDSLPGPAGARSVHRTSARGVGARRGADAVTDLVVDLVLDALRTDPTRSLGVVLADAPAAEHVGDAVRRAAAAEALPAAPGGAALLVAPPARWAGERRDHVVVVADAVGAVGGAALGDGGAAEVRAALTRSRARTAVVLDDSGWEQRAPQPPGPGRDLLLRTALRWEAEPAPGRSPDPGTAVGPVAARLAAACRELGLPVEEGVGTVHPVPLVVLEREAAGAAGGRGAPPALVVELDDAAWAARDAVEREVTVPARFEQRGWRHVRVLTADVHADVRAEADRLARVWADLLSERGRTGPRRVVDLTSPPTEVPTEVPAEGSAAPDGTARP